LRTFSPTKHFDVVVVDIVDGDGDVNLVATIDDPSGSWCF